jgi:hypothetical protein
VRVACLQDSVKEARLRPNSPARQGIIEMTAPQWPLHVGIQTLADFMLGTLT